MSMDKKKVKKGLVIVITGRDAPQTLIDYADLVTEMREIKHPFTTQCIQAQPGIEFQSCHCEELCHASTSLDLHSLRSARKARNEIIK
jgi:hypothetical protein